MEEVAAISPVDAGEAAGALVIQVDMRERHGPVPALLAAYPDVALRFGAMPSGDYILAEDAAVERKAAADFVASILDRRLFAQAARLKLLFPHAILLIEGSLVGLPHAIDQEAAAGVAAVLWSRSVCSCGRRSTCADGASPASATGPTSTAPTPSLRQRARRGPAKNRHPAGSLPRQSST